MNRTSYRVKKNRIEFDARSTLRFKYPIAELIEFDDVIVVRLEIPARAKYNENVFGISENGDLLWQVPSLPRLAKNAPYIGIGRDGDFARLNNWDGMVYWLAPKSGTVVKEIFGK